MIEFFITRTASGFAPTADGAPVAVFATEARAADAVVRFAQDLDAPRYRIIYP